MIEETAKQIHDNGNITNNYTGVKLYMFGLLYRLYILGSLERGRKRSRTFFNTIKRKISGELQLKMESTQNKIFLQVPDPCHLLLTHQVKILPSSASTSTSTLAEVSFNLHFSTPPPPPPPPDRKSKKLADTTFI